MNNIKPCWWGPHLWQTIYNIIAVYPDKPDNIHIESIKMFFISLKNLLPCEKCRLSYSSYLEEPDTNINTINNFNSRENLITFVYNLRNKVNNKLNNEYYISLNYFKKKLNKIICSNNNNNMDCYISSLIEVPFVPRSFEEKLYNYLKNKTNYNKEHTKQILNVCHNFMENPNFNSDNKYFKIYYKRNIKCRKIIDKIYFNISKNDYSLEESFLYDNDLHNKLFYLGSTIIPSNELDNFI